MNRRLDSVSDPTYQISLRTKISEMKTHIKDLKKEKKGLEDDQFIRERKMN